MLANSKRSKFVCAQCKQAHRKCDKEIPTCGECEKKGLICTYKKEKRKNRHLCVEFIEYKSKCHKIAEPVINIPHPKKKRG
jgi:hypothetical protein